MTEVVENPFCHTSLHQLEAVSVIEFLFVGIPDQGHIRCIQGPVVPVLCSRLSRLSLLALAQEDICELPSVVCLSTPHLNTLGWLSVVALLHAGCRNG